MDVTSYRTSKFAPAFQLRLFCSRAGIFPQIDAGARVSVVPNIRYAVTSRPFSIGMDSAFSNYDSAYVMQVNTVYRVTRLYGIINARDERHAMILVSWIETFIFIGVYFSPNDANKMM